MHVVQNSSKFLIKQEEKKGDKNDLSHRKEKLNTCTVSVSEMYTWNVQLPCVYNVLGMNFEVK